jgi:hypothetical protein
MTQQLINAGATANTGTGDTLRTGAQKINANFTELYTLLNNIQLPTYTLPTATTSILGGVKPDGSTITINNGIISAPVTNYVLPIATSQALGGVKIGANINITSGVISVAAPYSLPTASTSIKGGVKVDGSTITIDSNGVIHGTASYTLPTATTDTLGGVKVDGSSITISNGIISSQYQIPIASTTLLGGVIIDGTTIAFNNSGAITATTAGIQTRATATTVTGSLVPTGSTSATVVASKTYALYSIQVSAAAWVVIYSSSAAATADSSRSFGTPATPNSGVIAEVVTSGAETFNFSPALIGYSGESSPNTTVQMKIYNNGSGTAAITVTLTYLKLEV